jgi:hypothetical protein
MLSANGSMAPPKRKRPWYLVLALIGAVSLGCTGACGGWGMVTLYREPIDPSIVGQHIADEADRTAVVARFQAYLQALDAAKERGWPLAVATLILGTAILVASVRTLRGRGSARKVLIQLIVAQVGLSALSYWLMPRDVFDADMRFVEANQSADLHERIHDRPRADELARTGSHVLRAITPIDFSLRAVGSALIVFALTRRRAREVLDAPNEAVGAP